MKVKCIKSVAGIFTEGKIYECIQSNKCLTSAVRTLVTDDKGNRDHIIAEGILQEDYWFCEHFELLK